MAAMDWVVTVVLALPHLLYAFIWFRPKAWRRCFGASGVQAFHMAGVAGKILQGLTVLLWLHDKNGGFELNLENTTLTRCVLGAILIGAGQALNIGTFNAIGVTGVFYGAKLGHHVPWSLEFPFNVVAHPQYVGSALTVWGFAALLHAATKAPVVELAAYWTALYAITGVQEQLL